MTRLRAGLKAAGVTGIGAHGRLDAVRAASSRYVRGRATSRCARLRTRKRPSWRWGRARPRARASAARQRTGARARPRRGISSAAGGLRAIAHDVPGARGERGAHHAANERVVERGDRELSGTIDTHLLSGRSDPPRPSGRCRRRWRSGRGDAASNSRVASAPGRARVVRRDDVPDRRPAPARASSNTSCPQLRVSEFRQTLPPGRCAGGRASPGAATIWHTPLASPPGKKGTEPVGPGPPTITAGRPSSSTRGTLGSSMRRSTRRTPSTRRSAHHRRESHGLRFDVLDDLEHERDLPGRQLGLDARQQLCKERLVGQGPGRSGQGQTACTGAGGRQGPSRPVGVPAHFLCDGQDASPRQLRHARTAVQGVGHRPFGDAGTVSDIRDGGPPGTRLLASCHGRLAPRC